MSIETGPDTGESQTPANPHGRPRLLVWQDELQASPGHRALGLMNYVRRIGYVFQGNVLQYNALVARVQDPTFSLPILSDVEPGSHDDLLSEVERLLHNVLMALSTRVDQQRAFMSRYFADDDLISAEYATRIQTDFGDSAAHAFVRDLRNYLTHHRLPVAQSLHTFSKDSYKVTFILLRDSLLEWDRWKGAVKSWLRDQDRQIEIVALVNDYAKVAGGFDKWLHDRIGLKYANEIREYDAGAEAFNRERDRTFGLSPRFGPSS